MQQVTKSGISWQDYLDKVWGGWFGKCLGGAAGAPLEGWKRIPDISSFEEVFDPKIPNDDLDIQLLWLELLETKGLNFSGEDMARYWDEKCHYMYSEYGYFMKNYKRGINPPLSGSFNNPFFKEGMGCPIRSEIWGMIFPGDPENAARFAEVDGSLDHAGDSVWAEKFLAAIESMAFFVSDIDRLIDIGLEYVPAGSRFYEMTTMVREMHRSGKSWRETADEVCRRFGHHDFTNSIQNMGFILIALLYGKADMEATVNIALFCGYDTDCTCATAAAVLGIICGYKKIPDKLKEMINDTYVIGIDVKRSDNSIKTLAKDTCAVGASIANSGGSRYGITDIPNDLRIYSWERKGPEFEIRVDYLTQPAIGYQDTARIRVTVESFVDKTVNAVLSLRSDNPDICWDVKDQPLTLYGRGLFCTECEAKTGKIGGIPQTNIMTAKLTDSGGAVLAEKRFGLAGAWVFNAYGPFYDPAPQRRVPHYHPEKDVAFIFDELDSMVNNAVSLDRAYMDEAALLNGQADANSFCGVVNAYEDLIPLDQLNGIQGQVCYYLETIVHFREDSPAWLVIGNNDGFRLYLNKEKVIEKDEIRLWTPYNNRALVRFKKGANHIVIKLLRRTESLKFSIGIRQSLSTAGYHGQRWYTDLVYTISDKDNTGRKE